MAYISYTKVPLYFGTSADQAISAGPGEADAQNRSVIAQQVQLNYTPNIAPVKIVGKTPTKQNFNLAGPPNASLSFSCFIDGAEFNPSMYTGDVGDQGATFRLGDGTNGISGSGAFLNSFSYTLTPYAPVLVQCDFAIYNPLTTTNIGGKIADAGNDNVLDNLLTVTPNMGAYAHGAYSHIKGGSADYDLTAHEALSTPALQNAYDELTDIDEVLDDIETFESIQYQYTTQRLPVYELGSYSISKCEQISAEQTLSIQGDNIQRLVPITGDNPGPIILELKGTGANIHLRSVIDGRLNAENVSIQGGDLARGSVTITELLK